MSSASLVLDRFVSASSADDARDSLECIVVALQSKDVEKHLEPNAVWNDDETLDALLRVLATGECNGIQLDQGRPLVCEVYFELLETRNSTIILQKPQPGRLVQSLIDVLCNPEDSAYARVSALQVMRKICDMFPSVAQAQLLDVPNGLHRLADMIGEENEQVRNEVLLLSKVIAQWPSCAKIWVFADVCDTVVDLAVQEGGLTRGNILVMDCMDLLHSLLKHDPSLADLVWQSAVFAKKLSSLLDLRRGIEFLKPTPTTRSDDLEDILHSGGDQVVDIVPRLTPDEETLLGKVIELIGVILGPEPVRSMVWTHHPTLGSLLWELSLLSPPPIGLPYACAVPSTLLQQKALNCVSQFFASVETMSRHNGLDRLLYLVCTGGPSDKFEEKLGLSLSALHVIRKTLTDDAAKEIVMHTLAPPTASDATAASPTVVMKLLNTIVENIQGGSDAVQRKINLLGSLGALSVFMRDSTSREMILRITTPRALLDEMLKSLETEDEIILLSFLRFLSEWVTDSPAVVEAMFSSTQSTSLSVLFHSADPTAIFTGLLLGIAMEYMETRSVERYGGWTRSSILSMISKRKGGISGFMSQLEQFKTLDVPWKACRLEEATFLNWYNAQVLLVRSRIVQELTGDAADDDEQEFGLNALQKLVAQQSQESLELRQALALARTELQSSELQLSTWKRRVESAPTQLDSMLSEYAAKNLQLEQEVSSLGQKLTSLREMYELKLTEKEDLVLELRREIEVRGEREEGLIRDDERLQAELLALSTAYSNLEEEFNRVSSNNSEAVSDADKGEVARLQPQGEGSSQGQAGSELDALRAENAQLRNDARIADEWMQLAHQRMGEIGSQNIELSQEVTALKEMIEESKSSVDDGRSKANPRLEDAGACRSNASGQMESHDVQNVQSEFNERVSQAAPMSIMEPNFVESLNREIEELKSELQLARANAIASDEERRQLEIKLSSRPSEEGERVKKLETELQAKLNELDSLHRRIETLQDELTSSKSAMGVSLSQNEEAVKLDSNSVAVGLESESLSELQQLRAANVAAQEWMEKAVEHHQMLRDQVAALESHIEDLKLNKGNEYVRDIDENEEAAQVVGSKSDTSADVEHELMELRATKMQLDEICEKQKLKIDDLLSQMLKLTNDLGRQSDETDFLTSTVQEIEKRAVASEHANTELEKQVGALLKEKSLLDEQVTKLQQNVLGVAQLEAELDEQKRLVTLADGSTKHWKERATELEATHADLSRTVEVNSREAAETVERWELRTRDLESKVQCLEVDLQGYTERTSELEANISSLESALETQQASGLEALEMSSLRLSELNAAMDVLKRDYEALSTEKQLIEAKALEMSEALENELELNESLSMQINSVTEELTLTRTSLQKSVEGGERAIEALQTEIDMQVQIIRANEERAVAQEKRLKDLSYEIDVVKSDSRASLELVQARNRELESALTCAERSLEEQKSVQVQIIHENKESSVALEKEVTDLRSEMDALKVKSRDSLKDVQARNLELESALVRAEENTEARESQAITARQDAKILSKALEEENLKLSDELRIERVAREAAEEREGSLRTKLDLERGICLAMEKTIGDANSEFDAIVKQSEEAIAQWQELVAELEAQLEKQQTEAVDAITQWERECDELRANLHDLVSDSDEISRAVIAAVRAQHMKQRSWIHMFRPDEALPTDFDILEISQLIEVPDAVASMTEAHDSFFINAINDLMNKASSQTELSMQLGSQLNAKDVDLAILQQQMSDLTSIADEKDVLCRELEEKWTAIEADLLLTRNRNVSLEIELETMTNDLQRQIKLRDADIDCLQSKLKSSEEQVFDISVEKDQLLETTELLKTDLQHAEHALTEARARLDDAVSERLRLESALDEQHRHCQDVESRWEKYKKEKLEVLESLTEQRDCLEAEVVRLEYELEATSEVLQGQITDELSRRAVDIATHALRDEIELLRTRVDGSQDALVEERRARLAAEGESTSLKTDLAVMMRVQDDRYDDDEIKSLALKLADDIHQNELQEIDELRSTLESTLQEGELARAAEVEAVHRASMAELQASICEQEVIAAKSDFAFVTQTLDEARDAEAARVAAFEYRISALEEDRDVVRRFHADELETLRRELSHCSMEKDRILHSLKESERTNTALVYSTTQEQEIGYATEPEDELSKLRASNSQLLSSSADEAARTERRIREAIIASASLVEAEVLVEREMRVAAEAALENVKSQLSEARESQLVKSPKSDTMPHSPERLQTQLSQTRENSRRLEAENVSLRSQLEELKSEVAVSMADLRDRCQRAQSLALRLEGEAKFGSEVNSESLKIKSRSSKTSPGDWILVNRESLKTDGVPSVETFDFVLQQSAAIEEERKLYQELLSEHDDLLALLAQQALEKESLQDALKNLGGQAVVDIAIQKAEEIAVRQFGSYVRLS